MTVELPSQVAAVLLYDAQGCAPVFVVDLDSAKAGADVVDADMAAIEALMADSGLHARFSDRAVSGGRHLYVPLAVPLPHHDARLAAIALEELFSSVDSMPMRGATDGCIRPPGAWHRHGGHQVLSGPVEAAEAALDHPNDELAWRRFFDELLRRRRAAHAAGLIAPSTADDTATAGARGALNPLATPEPAHNARPAPPSLSSSAACAGDVAGVLQGDGEEQLEPLRGFTEPDADYQRIARTGEYDEQRYESPSEARQGVLWAAVASGWSFTDLVTRIENGTWPGMASFYAKYRDTDRHRVLSREWRKAVDLEKRRRGEREQARVRTTTTSARNTRARHPAQPPPRVERTRAQVERFVREWLVAVELLHGPRSDLTLRSLLVALAQMAVLSGTTDIQIGNRGLAIAAATDNGTISRLLRTLLDEPTDRALIDLVKEGRGVQAHVIELRIPDLLAPACAARPWRRGRIHGIRAAFRELGRAAAFVYDALGQLDAPIGGRELAAQARLSPSATYEALEVLAAWGLAINTGHGWRIGEASLGRLAEVFGVDDAVRAQIERYRAERRAWWAWLVARGRLDPAWIEQRTTPPPEPDPPPPRTAWEDDTSCVELLMRELGAQLDERAG
ncbi:hypothetical protein [Nocardioides maradonensis]